MSLNNLQFKLYLNTLRQKGNLAYEYNPLHNYLTEVDLYKVDDFLIPDGYAINPKNGLLLTPYGVNKYVDKRGNIFEENEVKTTHSAKLIAKAGSLIDLNTDKLNFDLEHPVDITIQPSYDGSVNLILNDDKNIPRLINSRFSVREKNTYEIVDRIGENDTNIYNSESFDKDSSLYFLYEYNPIIDYEGFIRGNLRVGQYVFYFTYCDADENESDYIAESGIIPVFIGSDSDPDSMDGGIKNQLTDKGIRLKLTNLDKSYNYLKIYYVRYFADYQLNRVFECKKIYRKYPINSTELYLQITGNENAEDIDANVLNISRFNPKHILTQALCKNMLFFGNTVKNSDNYKELTDCALRIVPTVFKRENFSTIDNEYTDYQNDWAYYSSYNIYNNVGYLDLEFYRFGVVFIYKNGTLSNVYNTLGYEMDPKKTVSYKSGNLFEERLEEEKPVYLNRKYINSDEFGWVKQGSEYFENIGFNVNNKGVCKLNAGVADETTILGIKFSIPKEVTNYLSEYLGIRGLFFVRLKRIPNILALCYLLPFDELLHAPVLEVFENGATSKITECFVSQDTNEKSKKEPLDSRLVENYYESRLYRYKYGEDSNENKISKHAFVGICPDFLLNLPYYNQIFNGAKFKLKKVCRKYLKKDGRFYYTDPDENNIFTTKYYENDILSNVQICTTTENVPLVALQDQHFKLEIGTTEEAFRFGYCEIDKGLYDQGNDDKKGVNKDFAGINRASNLVRGYYSPYLAIYSKEKLETSCLYNIYLDNVSNTLQEFQNRMDSSEPFYAISNRLNFSNLSSSDTNTLSTICYRGDCYINVFTHRFNRNFNDPSLPNNDTIIELDTWKNNYDIADPTKWQKIIRSDINAVLMGSWITFKVRSPMNYALRSQDHSFVSEEALMGSPRTYYPRTKKPWLGTYKMPDSYLYNDAYRSTLGFKCYFTLQDVNYIKDTFSNRIQYSALSILDSYKNNYRYSLSTYFRDYSQEYGSITKLVGMDGYLLVVFEHGIGLAVINERILAGEGDGNPVFINTQNVLPEELTIISDTYGSQWTESIIKSETGLVYGVDTVSKKIWRVKGQQLEILSDFIVNKFLIDNISLGERELYPFIGLRNVKTHYNNNKKDIMFTFYDDVYKDEEKVWNLCYNEIFGNFITFYSWVPSYSENIDTQFFTFNRNTSKELALLSKSNYNIPNNYGVLVDPPILYLESNSNVWKTTLHYVTKQLDQTIFTGHDDPSSVYMEKYGFYEYTDGILFKLIRDHWNNCNFFEIDETNILLLSGNKEDILEVLKARNLRTIYLEIEVLDKESNSVAKEIIAVTFKELVSSEEEGLTTDLYLHGQSGTIDIQENVYPTRWYGEQHPFEFEFVVNDDIVHLKIFNNLVIISNKAEPESFHFEIEGDGYEFSTDKRTMYVRQEATKELYLNLGSNMLFDRNYTDACSFKEEGNVGYANNENYYRGGEDYHTNKENNFGNSYPVRSKGLIQQDKSTIFPLYYEKVDTYNDIYHRYSEMTGDKYDFKNLSGSEIKWDKDLNLFNIVTHVKNSPMTLYGRARGNSYYKEGIWHIQIPTISFMLKNEDDWVSIITESNRLDSKLKYVLAERIDNGLRIFSLDETPREIENITELSTEDFNNYSLTSLNRDFDFIINSSGKYLNGTSLLSWVSEGAKDWKLEYVNGEWKIKHGSGCYISFNGLNYEGSWVTEPSKFIAYKLNYSLPPIIINSQNIPNDLSDTRISGDKLPNIYTRTKDKPISEYIKTGDWTNRKETRIRDKWMKVRVRYSGKNLAIIHSIATLYNVSLS